MEKVLTESTGQCICGAVRFVVSGKVSSFHICYCSRCRHSTGSAHAANIFTGTENITWLAGQELVQRFELAAAKSWAKQFCKVCGSTLPYINRSGAFLVVPAGSLDEAIQFAPDDRIFCQERFAWVDAIGYSPEFPNIPERF